MKYGVVFCNQSKNIGDDIQTFAASQLLPHVDYYIDRDNMNAFTSEEKVKLICNGWFMNNPLNWPPSNAISPLFVSFHVTHSNDCKKLLINEQYKNYYKQFEPIGCRDHETNDDFKKIGINSYYSGCITLTLENKFNSRTDDIYCVDAFYNLGETVQNRCIELLFPAKIRKKVKFLNQDRKSSIMPLQDRLAEAEKMIEIYSKAKLVITSRIHCALPCIALGTPVIFVDVGFKGSELRNRFSGITDYMQQLNDSHFPYTSFSRRDRWFRKLNVDKLLFKKEKLNINWDKPYSNPIDIVPIAEKIKQSVKNFISS